MNLLAVSNPWEGINVGEQLLLFSPMLALIVTMLAVVVTPIIAGREPRAIARVALAGTAVAFALIFGVARHVGGAGVDGLSPLAGSGMLIADNLSLWFQMLLLIFVAGVTALWWIGSADTERDAPEFFILLLGSALGMAMMASSTNLLMIVIAIETASLPSYALVGFNKRDRRGGGGGGGAEASLKYMVFGAICAATMLYGTSLLYGAVGSLNMADVAAYTVDQFTKGSYPILLLGGLSCWFVGIAFKISAVPFHFWCPDAFEAARIEVTTWLSVVSKAAALVLTIRLVQVFCGAVDNPQLLHLVMPFAWVLGILAAVTSTVGNFAAFMQTSVKRMLAYSSIAHAGYMLMAVAAFMHPLQHGGEASVAALALYIAIYLFMNLGAFGVTRHGLLGDGQ